MRINIPKLQELIDNQYRGNISFFSNEVGVDRGYLGQILNGQREADSPKVCNCIIKLCDSKNLNYKDYIILS